MRNKTLLKPIQRLFVRLFVTSDLLPFVSKFGENVCASNAFAYINGCHFLLSLRGLPIHVKEGCTNFLRQYDHVVDTP